MGRINWKKVKNIGKKLLNPLTPVNAMGAVADKISDVTGLGDNLSDTKVGKVANYVLNPVATAQGVRDIGEPVTEYAESHPQVVKLVGNALQVVGAGVTLIFPPVGGVITAAGTGIYYAGVAMDVKQIVTSIPDCLSQFKQALKNKDWSACLLILAYAAANGVSITTELNEFKLSVQNAGLLDKYNDKLQKLSTQFYTSSQIVENAKQLYEEIYNDIKGTKQGETTADEIFIGVDEDGNALIAERSELSAFDLFLIWFFDGQTIYV